MSLPPMERVAPAQAPELMDRPDCDPAALEAALDALGRANRLFGGWRLLRSGLHPLLADLPPGPVRLLDVGAGGGDFALALHRRLKARGWSPSLVLADLHLGTLRIARERLRSAAAPEALSTHRFVRLDAPELPFRDDSFDLAFSSTMLHHLERREAVGFLREMARVSRRGWVVTDLRRSRPTWWAVRLLAATLWRRNPLPRQDGPVSVRRAFTTAEARQMLRTADVRGEAGGGWPFRLMLRGKPGWPSPRRSGDAPAKSPTPNQEPEGSRRGPATPGRAGRGAGPDALVVGAGPAGSSLALRLARRGARVELLDACSFPRSKPCGDCLSPGANPLLSELGVLDEIAARADHLRGWRMRAPSGTCFEGRFGGGRGPTRGNGSRRAKPRGPRPRGLALAREDLDAVLLAAARRAGAEVRERTRVFGLLRDDGRVVGVRARGPDGGELTIRAGVVIGADGLRSVVARRLGGVRRGTRKRLALVGRFGAAEGRPASGRPESGIPATPGTAGTQRDAAASLGHMRLSREGCLGMARVGSGRRNVTLVVPFDRAEAISEDRRGFYFDRLARYGVASRFPPDLLLGELEITGPFEITPRCVAAPGALLVGDAAGYFDPFTGQGIYRALASARLAAGATAELLASRSDSETRRILERFEAGLSELLLASRRLQRWIDAVVRRPSLVNPLSRLLARRPAMASLFVSVTGDLLPPGAAGDPVRLGRALFAGGKTVAY